MADIRVTQQVIEVPGRKDAEIQVTNLDVQVVGATTATPQLAAQSIDVIGTPPQPELRVTQASVDVAGYSVGELRLARVYLEVLRELPTAGEIEVNASNNLSFITQAFSGLVPISASNSLGTGATRLQGNATVTLWRPQVNADSNLAFTTDATYTLFRSHQYLTQTLTFSHTGIGGHPIAVETGNALLADDFYGDVSYVGPKSVSASSVLELESDYRFPEVFEKTASNNVAFTQIIGLTGDRSLAASSPINFITIADNRVKVRDVTSELDFAQAATGNNYKIVSSELVLGSIAIEGVYALDVENELDFAQTVRPNPRTIGPLPTDDIYFGPQELAFTQTARSSIIYIYPTSTLDFAQTLNVVRPYYESVSTILQWTETEINWEDGSIITTLYGLQDAATVEIDVARNISSPVWFSQFAKKVRIKAGAIDCNASSTLTLESTLPGNVVYLAASNTLDFIDYADNRHEFTTTELELESDVAYNILRAPIPVEHILSIISTCFVEKNEPDLCNYAPSVGSTTDPAAPQNYLKNVPVLDSGAHGVTLFYPWEAPTTTIYLRGPDLSNRNRLEFQRINRETRGGTLIVWADPMWPKNEKLVLGFSGLKEAEGQNLLDFIYLTLGKEIGLTDWEGNTWKVVTMTPNDPLVRNGRCNLSINLEFEITRSTTRGRGSNEINLTDAATRTIIRNRDDSSHSVWLISEVHYELEPA
jgi:hypothetical protein